MKTVMQGHNDDSFSRSVSTNENTFWSNLFRRIDGSQRAAQIASKTKKEEQMADDRARVRRRCDDVIVRSECGHRDSVMMLSL